MLDPVVAPVVADALGRRPAASSRWSRRSSPTSGCRRRPTPRRSNGACTAIEAGGAVPAVTAVLDGRPRVGLEPAEHEPDPRPGPQGRRARPRRGRRPALGLRRDDRVGVGRPRRRPPASPCSPPAASAASTAAPRSRATSRPTSTRSPTTRSSRCAPAPRRSSTCRARSSTSRRPACRCSAGATTGSRRSTRGRPGSRCRTASSRRRGRGRSSPTAAGPTTGVLLTVADPGAGRARRGARSTTCSSQALADAAAAQDHRRRGHAVRARPHRRGDGRRERARQPRPRRAQRRRRRRGRRRGRGPPLTIRGFRVTRGFRCAAVRSGNPR